MTINAFIYLSNTNIICFLPVKMSATMLAFNNVITNKGKMEVLVITDL